MPCISPEVVSCLFDLICESDAAIPCWNNEMYEPLHAVYRRTALLTYLEKCESRSLRGMVRDLDATYVPVERLRRYDPTLETFRNINRLEELDKFTTTDSV
jgi:molybdopterin-guanine dinucleotide biosynthesis protein A